MNHLETLRSWRSGHASRVLTLHGYDGAAGCTLIEFAAGLRRTASYDSLSTAALAVTDGQIRWRSVAPGMREALSPSRRASAARGSKRRT